MSPPPRRAEVAPKAPHLGTKEPHLLVHASAVEACRILPASVSFDLVYLDPPYGVGTTMTARTRRGEARGRKQRASGPDAYVDASPTDALVAMIAASLAAIRPRMRASATAWVHLDHRAVHEVKVAADGVFGRGAFLGEIIWVPGNGGRGAGLSVTHQTILVYAKSQAHRADVTFHYDDPDLREPYAETSLSMHFSKVDADGRRYRERTIGGKTYRYYADRGRRLGSVWTDIPAMVANTPLRPEATGYPTQKPVRLLERIIRAASAPGDTVVDLMCGSGTTLVAAAGLGRRFVGGDVGELAVSTTEERLTRAGIRFERAR
jgi:site-specific DNA-methyltransferase (adenine-specific)